MRSECYWWSGVLARTGQRKFCLQHFLDFRRQFNRQCVMPEEQMQSPFWEVKGFSSKRRTKIWSTLRYVGEITQPGFAANDAVTKYTFYLQNRNEL
jgi:hypothetical protein